MSATSTIDPAKLASLIEAEEATFNERHTGSREMTERARQSLAGGVASSWQMTDPHPIYLADGHGSKVSDVDGNEYVDFHNGYGAMAVGHGSRSAVRLVECRLLGLDQACELGGVDCAGSAHDLIPPSTSP